MVAARGRAELEREARGWGRAAVRRDAHVEEADLEAAPGVRRRRRVVHPRGGLAGEALGLRGHGWLSGGVGWLAKVEEATTKKLVNYLLRQG